MLQRSKLNNIFDEYQSKINRESFNINIVKEVLEKIKNNLNNAESKSDSRFKLYGRMLILKEQLDNNLNNKNYVDSYFNIKEFLDQSRNSLNDKPDIVDSNIEYYKEDIICSEEKESLIEMIDKYLKDLPTNEKELNNNGLSDFDREMMKKFNIDSNINNIKDLSKAINEKKKEMLINESKEQAKKICESIGEDINNFDVDVFENIDAVLYTPKYQQRGISGFAIADDGTYEIFGSINALPTYIKEFEDKYNEKIKTNIDNFIYEDDDKINNQNIFIPDSLKDYISFDEDGYVFANQKLPSELENDYKSFINSYYMGDNKVVNNIINKIKELPYNLETTIAQLIKYNPEVAFVSPMTQGIIKSAVNEKCKNYNIEVEENRNEFGGLPYYIKFKKIDNLLQHMDNVQNITFEEAKEQATKYANECNKKIIGAKENNDYYYFETERAFDDGAGNCYINKKDGKLVPEHLWKSEIQELNARFRENSKVIDINNN